MPTKLFIGNISDSCTEDDLKAHFEGHGKVVELAIIRNYGFVHFEQHEDAEKAMKALHNSPLKGTMIRVEISNTPFKTGAGRRLLDSANRGRFAGGRPGYGKRDRGGHQPGHQPPSRDRYHPYYDRYSREQQPSWSEQPRYGYNGGYDSRREDYPRSYDHTSGDNRAGYTDNRYSDYYSGRQRNGDPVRYPEQSSNRY